MSNPNIRVLIVCLGNICRSPIGEAVLKNVAEKRGITIQVDSAGTAAYHVGEDPDSRSVSTCKKFGVPISHHARQAVKSDFKDFTHILAADESNLKNLERIKPRDATAVVRLWGSYLDDKPMEDPYYGGMNGFEKCFNQAKELSDAFLDEVVGKQE